MYMYAPSQMPPKFSVSVHMYMYMSCACNREFTSIKLRVVLTTIAHTESHAQMVASGPGVYMCIYTMYMYT